MNITEKNIDDLYAFIKGKGVKCSFFRTEMNTYPCWAIYNKKVDAMVFAYTVGITKRVHVLGKQSLDLLYSKNSLFYVNNVRDVSNLLPSHKSSMGVFWNIFDVVNRQRKLIRVIKQ